jgi:prephenate dehydrogenase
MWRDICLANREPLLAVLDGYLAELGGVRELMAAGEGEALERIFAQASAARLKWAEGP